MWFLKAGRPRLGAAIPPGFSTPDAAVAALRGRLGAVRHASLDQLIEDGIMIAGTPDAVIAQIRRLHERTGVGHLLMMNQAGDMTSNEVRDSLELFAREVMPAVAALGTDWRDADAFWRVANDDSPVTAVVASALS
jgi:alkanesulfonate monooxygenase SsuD/methylene tetrahydromethanopterin reductase-like flavin-dependent oxidoreductase (luciferase family)